jgi:hypothetical protein
LGGKMMLQTSGTRAVAAAAAFLIALRIGTSMAAQSDTKGLAFTGEFPSPLMNASALTTAVGATLSVGLRITNDGSIGLRLSTYHSVLPELVDAAGRIVPFDYGANRSRPPQLSDYPMLLSGHSLVIHVDATMTLRGAQLDWKGSDGTLGFWNVSRASAPYHFRLKYSQRQRTAGPFEVGSQSLNGIWIGEAVTDVVDLPLKLAN